MVSLASYLQKAVINMLAPMLYGVVGSVQASRRPGDSHYLLRGVAQHISHADIRNLYQSSYFSEAYGSSFCVPLPHAYLSVVIDFHRNGLKVHGTVVLSICVRKQQFFVASPHHRG